MHPDKSLGLDGMNPTFYQKLWNTVGGDVTSTCLLYSNEHILLEGLNDTSIVLIPKKKSPKIMVDLRLISLCNVLFKIIKKVIENQLKTTLPVIILEPQSVFVPRRLITNNIMIAFEINYFLKRKRKERTVWLL